MGTLICNFNLTIQSLFQFKVTLASSGLTSEMTFFPCSPKGHHIAVQYINHIYSSYARMGCKEFNGRMCFMPRQENTREKKYFHKIQI